jgi:threonine dehydrogenase-like Zn-dependent dehydrogenase
MYFQVPQSLPLHEVVSIPDNYTTAMYTVFGSPNLALPIPSSLLPLSNVPERPAVDLSAPVLVYGAGASSGQFALQALRIAGFANIFAVAASHHHDFLRSLGATQCFDYRSADVVLQIRAAIAQTKHARLAVGVDVIATRPSLTILSQLFDSDASASGPASRLAILAPFKDGDNVTNASDSVMHFTFPPWLDALFADKKGVVELVPIYTFRIHQDPFSHDNIMPVLLPRLLERGEIRPNPIRLLKDGKLLDRFHTGLDLLRKNKISGEKVVIEFKLNA